MSKTERGRKEIKRERDRCEGEERGGQEREEKEKEKRRRMMGEEDFSVEN